MIDISGHLRPYRSNCGFEDSEKYITINCCGYQKFISKNVIQSREKGRLDYQLIYIVNGKGIFLTNGKEHVATEGNIVIYKPEEAQYYSYSSKDSTEVYWIHFTGSGVKETLEQLGLYDNSIYYVGLENICIELFKKIIFEMQIKNEMFVQFSTAYFFEVLAHFSRMHKYIMQNNKTCKDSNMQKVIQLMHSKYNRKLSVEDFAVQCNLSVYRFIHKFKLLTGMPPMSYFLKIRIDKAKELLLDSNLSINEIANVVGYDNSLYFSRVFKKETGISPTNYRNEHSN